MHFQHPHIGTLSEHVQVWAGDNMVKASPSGQASSRAVSGCPFRARWARLRAPQASPLGPVWAQRGGHPRPAAPGPGGCPGRDVPCQRGHEQQPVHQLAGHALGHHRPAAGTSSAAADWLTATSCVCHGSRGCRLFCRCSAARLHACLRVLRAVSRPQQTSCITAGTAHLPIQGSAPMSSCSTKSRPELTAAPAHHHWLASAPVLGLSRIWALPEVPDRRDAAMQAKRVHACRQKAAPCGPLAWGAWPTWESACSAGVLPSSDEAQQ